jgi:porin
MIDRSSLVARRAAGWKIACLLAAALAGIPTLSYAQEQTDPPSSQGGTAVRRGTAEQRPTPSQFGITGDWGGVRTQLVDAGVLLTASYGAEGAYNASGGDRSIYRTANQATIGATLDLDRIIGNRGGTVQVTITQRHGANLGNDAGIPTILPIQELWGRGNIARLTEFWVKQQVAPNLLVKAGRMPAGDFGSFPCEFMNLALCANQPGHTVYDYFTVWPISQWGAWARYGNESTAYVQVGAYQVSPKNLNQGKAFEVGDFTGATGVLLPAEVALFPILGDGLKGSLKLGGWYETSDSDDVLLNTARRLLALDGGQPLRRKGRYGGYVTAVQQIWRPSDGAADPDRGVSLFLNVLKADRGTALIDFEYSLGAFWRGPFATRGKDLIGLGFASSRVNPRTAQHRRLLDPATAQASEKVFEAFYSAHIGRSLLFQPGFQQIVRPGGLVGQGDASIFELKTVLTF